MKSKFNWFMTLLLLFSVQVGFAQVKTVTGVVKDVEGYPVPGASILIKGTDKGTETDDEGFYKLSLKPGDQIMVSSIGFEPKNVVVGATSILNVVLSFNDGEDLGEVVIDAYRVVSEEKSNVASANISAESIENRPNASFVQTLQGQASGLNISSGSGQPGSSNTSIRLRGTGSINGNTEPLFVIDGVPMASANFRSINPNDIENVSVLKDAGATSIFGNRGANGVIVVTTKRANFESDLQVKYASVTGVSTIQRYKYDKLNSQELMNLENVTGKFTSEKWTDEEIESAPNTDWIDVFYRPAISQSHTVSFTSGSKNMGQFTSVGYRHDEGILRNTDLKRFNFRSNVNGKSNNGRLKYNTGITLNASHSNRMTGLGTSGVNRNPALAAVQSVPYYSVDDYQASDNPSAGWDYIYGKYQEKNGGSFIKLTPFLIEDLLNTYSNYSDEIKSIVNGSVSYDLGKGFEVGTRAGIDYTTIQTNSFEKSSSFNAYYFAQEGQDYAGSQTQSDYSAYSFNTVTSLKWNTVINDKHSLSAAAFVEYLKNNRVNSRLSQEGVKPEFAGSGFGDFGWIKDGGDDDFYVPSISRSIATSGLFSYFGTFDYDYDSKYGIGLSARRDASFRFAAENRWGTFWSASARWNVHQESFMEDSFINELKFRGSYGTSGNQDILGTGLFGAASLFREVYSLNGSSYADSPTMYLSNLPNPNLKWETISQGNVGVEFGLWNSRVRGVFDVYQKITNDLYQSRPISAIHGSSSVMDNVGSLSNSGVELMLGVDVVRNDNLKITLNANGSVNDNKVLALVNPDEDGKVWNGGRTVLQEGGALGQFYLVDYAGVNPDNGEAWFVRKNGENSEFHTDEDRKFTGKSYIPKYQGGFGLETDYKGWYAVANFTFVADVWRFDGDYSSLIDVASLGGFAASRDILDYWKEKGDVTSIPSPQATNLSYISNSNRDLRDASYVRLRFLSLGYNFSQKSLASLKLSGLKVYAMAENVHTWSNWKGWDAESNRSMDYAQYPTPRTVSLGVEVQF